MAQPLHTRVRGLEAHRDTTKAFCQLVETISRREGLRDGEVMSRWLTMSCSALANPALRGDQAAWDANEERYMAEVRRFRHKETADEMAQLLAITVEALEAEASDFLGPIYSEVGANAAAGQFFTPWHVSYTIAKMTLTGSDLVAEILDGRRRFLSMQEPACGSGGMALAANEVLRELGVVIPIRTHWTCIDVDWRCVCMTYIQLSLTGSSAVVVHGNALSLEVWNQLPTIMTKVFPKRRQADDPPPVPAPAAEIPTPVLTAAAPEPRTAAAAKPQQLELF